MADASAKGESADDGAKAALAVQKKKAKKARQRARKLAEAAGGGEAGGAPEPAAEDGGGDATNADADAEAKAAKAAQKQKDKKARQKARKLAEAAAGGGGGGDGGGAAAKPKPKTKAKKKNAKSAGTDADDDDALLRAAIAENASSREVEQQKALEAADYLLQSGKASIDERRQLLAFKQAATKTFIPGQKLPREVTDALQMALEEIEEEDAAAGRTPSASGWAPSRLLGWGRGQNRAPASGKEHELVFSH